VRQVCVRYAVQSISSCPSLEFYGSMDMNGGELHAQVQATLPSLLMRPCSMLLWTCSRLRHLPHQLQVPRFTASQRRSSQSVFPNVQCSGGSHEESDRKLQLPSSISSELCRQIHLTSTTGRMSWNSVIDYQDRREVVVVLTSPTRCPDSSMADRGKDFRLSYTLLVLQAVVITGARIVDQPPRIQRQCVEPL
jgi:hypothetical protein